MADPFNAEKYAEDQAVDLSALSYVNQSAKRNLEVAPELVKSIRESVTAVYGPDYRVEVMSGAQGKGSRGVVGSRRHTTEAAADIWVRAPDGKKLTGDDLVPLSQHWLATKTGSVGFPARAGQSLHLDLVGGSGPGSVPRKPGEGALWYYGTPTKSQREALGSALTKGVMPKYAVSPEAVRKGLIPPGSIPEVASLTDTASRPTPVTMSAATAAKRQAVIPTAYDSPRSNAAVMALYAGIPPATPAVAAPAPKPVPVASPLTILTGSARASQRVEQQAQRAATVKPVASGVGGANIAGVVALPKGVVPKAATAAMEQAKAAAGVKPTPKPPVAGLIKLVDPSARKDGLASVPAGMPLNSGSRDSVAKAAAGRTAAAGMATTAAQKQQAAEQARQRADAAARQQIQIASRARAEAARAASLRAAQQVATKARTAVAIAAKTGGVVIDNAVYGSGGSSYGSNPGQSTAGLKPGDRTYNPDTNSWGLKV